MKYGAPCNRSNEYFRCQSSEKPIGVDGLSRQKSSRKPSHPRKIEGRPPSTLLGGVQTLKKTVSGKDRDVDTIVFVTLTFPDQRLSGKGKVLKNRYPTRLRALTALRTSPPDNAVMVKLLAVISGKPPDKARFGLRWGQATKLKTDDSVAYESTALFAADNSEAIERAKHWTASFDSVAKDAWLQINLNGVGIRSLRPGEF
jgi:hypothetical protein